MPDSLADARGPRPRKNARTQATYQGTDACGTAPRMNPRSASPGVEADACGIAPRMTSRSALPGVDADACGTAPRKTSRPVGRGRRPRGRRPNRRRSLNYVRPSLPRLSPDSTGIDGEIALLRSLTNRLLSTRPLDYTQVNRCLRLIIRAFSAQAKAPKQLTDQEQIDNLIKKIFHQTVDEGEISFFDLLPVRKAKPGDKWWPWRDLIPLRTRREYGLIDPNDPWPHEDEEYFATMDALDEAESSYYGLSDDDLSDDTDTFDEDPDDEYEQWPDPDDPDQLSPDDDDDFDPDDDTSPNPSVIPVPRPGWKCAYGVNPGSPHSPPSPVEASLVGALPGGGAAHAEPVEVRAGGGPRPAYSPPHDEDPSNPPASPEAAPLPDPIETLPQN